MPNLRLLEVDGNWLNPKIDLEPSHQECFRYLAWVSWHGFPFKYIPNNFDLGNLVILDMPWNKLKEVWKGTKYLKRLKELNLRYSRYLIHTPDFSELPNLEKLILISCDNLVEVDESIDQLKKLVRLDLSYCLGLKNLPISGMSELASLETLNIAHCRELENFRMRMGNLISSNGLCSLKEVSLECCCLTDNDIPDEFWMLHSLESLNLNGNYFESLPSSIGQLSKLEILDVTHCLGLKSLPMLPSSLRYLEASYCYELERLPNLSNLKHLTMLHLSSCEKLTEFEGLECLISAESIKLNHCDELESFAEKRIFQEVSKNIGNRDVCDIIFDGYEVPSWFGFQREMWSDSLSCQVPHQLPNMEIQGLVICFACKELGDHCFDDVNSLWYTSPGKVVVDNKSKNFTWSRTLDIPLTLNKTTTWVIKIPNCVRLRPAFTQPSLFNQLTKEKQALVEFSSTGKIFPKSFVEYGDTIQVSFSFLDADRWVYPSVKKIGVHFFYASSSQHENVSQENFQASPENSQASQSIKCCGFLR